MKTLDTRLGFVSARSAFVDQHGLWVEAGLARLIEPLGRGVRETRLALSVWRERRALDTFPLRVVPGEFHPLPCMPSFAKGVPGWRESRTSLLELQSRCDVLVVQLPFTAPLALLSLSLPVVYHVCADPLSFVQASRYWRGWKRIPALMGALVVNEIQRRLVRSPLARTVTNGAALLAQLRPREGRAVISTALTESDLLSVRRKRTEDGRFRLLFVGYLRPEKGFDILVRAMVELVDGQAPVDLVVVGAEPAIPRSLGEISARLDRLVAEGRVAFRGALPFGEDLFQEYADADLLVLPSRSEGTPRVLVEARAFGCPVVASRVGGIPFSVQDGVDGLLVPAEDSKALAGAIRAVMNDDRLRTALIGAGLRRAQEWTSERFAETLLEEVASVEEEALGLLPCSTGRARGWPASGSPKVMGTCPPESPAAVQGPQQSRARLGGYG